MPDSDFYLAPTYLKLVLSEPELADIVVQTLGPDLEDLLQTEFVPAKYIEPIFQAFDEAGLDSWVLKFGRKLSSTTHAALGFAALSAPTLSDSLRVFSEFACVRTSAYNVSVRESGQRLIVTCDDNTNSELLGRWLIETAIYVEKRLIENIMTHSIGEQAQIRFKHAAPPYAAELERLYQIPCRYLCKENALCIPASWGYVPSPLHDPETFQTNLAKCRDIKRRIESKSSTLDFVKTEFELFFQHVINGRARPSNLPSLIHLADKLALSPRTFARKLELQGSSYKQELAIARRRVAQELLQNTHLRVADIAYYLGYRETANFIRAFKTWNTCTPSQWRISTSNALIKHK